MRCHDCGAEILIASGASIGFREECDQCRADLHVCLNCVHHDPSAYNECREPSAERVADRDRANRCDYFRPGAAAASGRGASEKALSALEDLFRKD